MAFWQPKQTYLHGHIFMGQIEFKNRRNNVCLVPVVCTFERQTESSKPTSSQKKLSLRNKQLLISYALKAASYGNYWLIHWFQTKALKTSNYWQRQVISLKLLDAFVHRKKVLWWNSRLHNGDDLEISPVIWPEGLQNMPTIIIGGLSLFLFYSAEI